MKAIKDKGALKFIFDEPRCDHCYVRKIEEEVLKELGAGTKVIFDLEKVEFIASAFIRLCLQTAQIAGKDNFEVINAHKYVSNILSISRLDRFIKVSSHEAN